MNEINPIIEKIKKLLRMKHGGTPDEIATALRLAQELAEKHGIDLGSVNPEESEARPLSHDEVYRSARIQKETAFAGLICQSFFNVTSLISCDHARSGRRWRDFQIFFIGEEWDRQIARYVFEFLCGEFRREWNHRANKRLKNRDAFMHGMYIAICHKLDQKQPDVEESGLILRDQRVVRRQDYLKAQFGETGKRNFSDNSDATASKWAGFQAGAKTEIRGGLTPAATPARQSLPPTSGQLALL